jgi:NAD(P)-dependent dehydrogenase (short-subunit alcohol dehydrogenase family)
MPLSETECYVCKQPLGEAHWFYPRLCVACGDFNYAKRSQRADLSDYVAIVTGGRVKIGYETVLRLLRWGATVVTTTRFPNDAARRFALEPDFQEWSRRLSIVGLDLRHIRSTEVFITRLKRDWESIDILVNNAAQTIRRPPLFYRHLLDFERSPIVAAQLCDVFAGRLGDVLDVPGDLLPLVAGDAIIPAAYANRSAELSQTVLLSGDEVVEAREFPAGSYDKDGQQQDRRDTNSWMLELDDVNVVELYEVLAVNLVSPFLLTSRLKPLLARRGRHAFIVNVTSMEGNFNAPNKKTRHPHTNMAKAALNMMTRTSAEYYADAGIIMNSVDTGWITNEKPFPLTSDETARRHQMAIDEGDGAARVLDPIVTAVNGERTEFGKLYKNYREYPW